MEVFFQNSVAILKGNDNDRLKMLEKEGRSPWKAALPGMAQGQRERLFLPP